MPGSRCVNGRIALKRCVTCVAPRSNAACASSAVASVWPHAATTPRATQQVDELERAVELRRERHVRHRPRGEQPLEQREVGVAPRRRGVHAEPRAARGTAPRGGRRGSAGRRRSAAPRAATRRARPRARSRTSAETRSRPSRASPRPRGGTRRRRPPRSRRRRSRGRAGRRSRAPRCPRRAPARPTRAIASVVDLDVACDEPAVDERRLDAEPHSARSAGYSRRNRSYPSA